MKILISLVLLLSQVGLAIAETNKQRAEQLRGKTPKQAEALFSKWLKAEPKNLEVLLLKAGYYLHKARKVEAPQKSKQAAMPPKVSYDQGLLKTAAEAYTNALAMAPERLDIYFGLALANQHLGRFDEQFKNLEAAVKLYKEKPKTVKWYDGKPLKNAADVLPRVMLQYMDHYQYQGNKQADERFLKIAKLALDAFPDNVFSLNSLGGYYFGKKEFDKALGYLKKAHGIDRSDCVVLGNIAGVYIAQRDKGNATATLKQIVSSCKNPEIVKQAKADLEKLGKMKK